MPKSHTKDTPPPAAGKIAAVYARVSTADQADKGFSLPTQIEACQAMARQEGYAVPDGHIFQDDYTGTSLNLPQFVQLRELVRQQLVQAIFVYDLDRLSRPSQPPQPRRQPVPSHPSCPCPAARGASGTPWWGARQGGRREWCGPTPGAGTSGRREWADAVGGKGRLISYTRHRGRRDR
jgi:hypothetical protein